VMRPPPRVHKDYVIVSIDPLPANPLQFHIVREVVEEFLEKHMNVRIRDVQPTHLGQALVRFGNIFYRDLLVNNSPHPYGGVNFHVVRHSIYVGERREDERGGSSAAIRTEEGRSPQNQPSP
jgi:hypothetical protein